MLFLKNRAFFTRCFIALAVGAQILSYNSTNAQKSSGAKLSKVVIDAGHGGKDPGARGRNSLEKDIVLAVALKLGKLISDNFSDVQVIYTRKTDEFIPLYERSNIANKHNANLFISIHANSNRSSVPFGAETYVMGLHKSADNFEVAATENSAIIQEDDYNVKYEGFNPKSVESYIIFSMMQSKFLDQSLYFAQVIQSQMIGYANRSNRGVKQAGFLVLWQTAMPSVLVELGFISNPSDERYMMSEKGQNELAESLYRSFKSYKVSYETSNYVQLPDLAIQGESTDTVPRNVVGSNPGEQPKNSREVSSEQVNPDIVFRIQISAKVGSPLTRAQRKTLGDNVDEIITGRVYKYTKGKFYSLEEANAYLIEVKRSFRDAFVIAFDKGELISINEAIRRQQ